MTNRRAALVGIAAPLILALILLMVAPAAAHHKSGHDKGGGKAKAPKGSGYTEDNDRNDGGTPNNVADDGDNRHPSGKDKSVEPGGSGNQGNSSSDPDDDGRGPDRSNGGADKPDGPGGVDLADQDGNNGCGNDDDFEDDNEGWCGKNPKARAKSKKANKATDSRAQAKARSERERSQKRDDEVAGSGVEAPAKCPAGDEMAGAACVAVAEALSKGETTEVLGRRMSRAARDVAAAPGAVDRPSVARGERGVSTLPLTGSGVLKLLALAALLVAAGLAMLRGRRRA